MHEQADSQSLRNITCALGPLVERIRDAYNKWPTDREVSPTIRDSAFKLMRNATYTRGKVVVIWADTEALANTVVVNLIRKLVVEDRLTTLRVGAPEEEDEDLSLALLAATTECPMDDLNDGRLSDQDWGAMATALGLLHDSPLYMLTGMLDSLPDCIKQWKVTIADGLRQLVIFQGVSEWEFKTARPSFPTWSPYGKTSDLVATMSEVAIQEGLCVITVLENPFRDQVTIQQLMRTTSNIPASGVETFAVEAESENSIRITWVGPHGKSMTVYRHRPMCCRIDWDGENMVPSQCTG